MRCSNELRITRYEGKTHFPITYPRVVIYRVSFVVFIESSMLIPSIHRNPIRELRNMNVKTIVEEEIENKRPITDHDRRPRIMPTFDKMDTPVCDPYIIQWTYRRPTGVDHPMDQEHILKPTNEGAIEEIPPKTRVHIQSLSDRSLLVHYKHSESKRLRGEKVHLIYQVHPGSSELENFKFHISCYRFRYSHGYEIRSRLLDVDHDNHPCYAAPS